MSDQEFFEIKAISCLRLDTTKDFINGTLEIVGVVQLVADGIDFEKSYSFKLLDGDGSIYYWHNVKPRREGSLAVFELADQLVVRGEKSA